MKSKSEPREHAESADILNKYGLEIIHRVPKKTLDVPSFFEHVRTERRLGTEDRVQRNEDREKTLLDAIQFYPIDFFSKK